MQPLLRGEAQYISKGRNGKAPKRKVASRASPVSVGAEWARQNQPRYVTETDEQQLLIRVACVRAALTVLIITVGFIFGSMAPVPGAHWSEVLVVVYEVRQLAAVVHRLASGAHTFRESRGPAAEHAHFAHLQALG